MPLFSLDRSPTLVDRPYSPQRAMRLGGLAGAGSMVAVVGIMVSGGGSSASNSAATTDSIDPAVSVAAAPETIAATAVGLPTDAASVATVPATTVPTTTLAPATTLAAPVCTNTYIVLSGDYWVLIAKEASISVDALYAANNATSATALFPGQTVCLPDGSTVVVTTAPAVTVGTTAATTKTTVTKATVKKTTTTTAAPAPVATTANTSSHSSG
jgi:hypothetical protein